MYIENDLGTEYKKDNLGNSDSGSRDITAALADQQI